MSIVTKTGDNGESSLFGGKRAPKDNARFHAIGDVDELNSILGLVLATKDLSVHLSEQILHIQHLLFRMGADIGTPRENNEASVPRLEQEHVAQIEEWIDALEKKVSPPPYFVLPGGSTAASLLHTARAVCRRTERSIITFARKEGIGREVQVYLNRLSDFLFLAALESNRNGGTEDVRVRY